MYPFMSVGGCGKGMQLNPSLLDSVRGESKNYKRLQECLGVTGEESKGREEPGGRGNHYGVFRGHPAKGWGEEH